MLMDKNNKIIAVARADAARSIEYMRMMNEDAMMNSRILQIDEMSDSFNESVDESETMEILSQFTADGDEDKEEEINRILDASSDLTFDEMIGIQQGIGEVYEAAFMEGVNMDYHEVSKYMKKNVNPEIKVIKKAIKERDVVKAEAARKRCLKHLKIAKSMFESIEINDSIPSTIIGNILKSVINTIIILLTSLLSLGILAIPTALILDYQLVIDTANALIVKIKNNKKISFTDFNMYKNGVSSLFDNTERVLEKSDAIIKNIDGITKESVNGIIGG